jgi:GntR family transcriptional regulator
MNAPVNDSVARAPREPKYYTAKRRLLECVESLQPGSAVPTERELSAELGISRTTVRQASFDLIAEGRLIRRQGSGTYVAEPKMVWPLTVTSFTARAADLGFKPSSQLLAVERIRADNDLAGRLAVKEGAPIFRIERLRLADDRPMAVETSHLPSARFPRLSSHIRHKPSLYGVLQQVYGVVPARAKELISTAPAPPRAASLLRIDTGAPALFLGRLCFDGAGEPIEWVTSWYRGDRVTLEADLLPPHQ